MKASPGETRTRTPDDRICGRVRVVSDLVSHNAYASSLVHTSPAVRKSASLNARQLVWRFERLTEQPPQGPEQRREAPADRSGAERGLAPRPRSRTAGGTEGTENEQRCGSGRGAVYILHLRESNPRSLVFHGERSLGGGTA